MTQAMFMEAGPAGIRARLTAYATAAVCGAIDGLKVCIDAGDALSYPGSGQTVTNRAGSPTFQFGPTSGSEASDPAFVGTAGRASSGEYFNYTFAEDDVIGNASAVSETWHDNFHKENATFSSLFWGYWTSTAQNQRLWSDNFNSAAAGAMFYIANTNLAPQLDIKDATGVDIHGAATSMAINANAWNCIGQAGDEGPGTWHWLVNMVTETDTGAPFISAASSGSSSGAFCIGRDPNSGFDRGWGGRIAWAMVWTITLAAQHLLALNMSSRGKFSL